MVAALLNKIKFMWAILHRNNSCMCHGRMTAFISLFLFICTPFIFSWVDEYSIDLCICVYIRALSDHLNVVIEFSFTLIYFEVQSYIFK